MGRKQRQTAGGQLGDDDYLEDDDQSFEAEEMKTRMSISRSWLGCKGKVVAECRLTEC